MVAPRAGSSISCRGMRACLQHVPGVRTAEVVVSKQMACFSACPVLGAAIAWGLKESGFKVAIADIDEAAS